MKLSYRLLSIAGFLFLSFAFAPQSTSKDFGTIRPELSEELLKNLHTARVDIRGGLYRRAVERLDRVISLQPTFVTAYLERGRAYRKLGNIPRARADFERVKDLAPLSSPILVEVAFEDNELELEKRLPTWLGRPHIRCDKSIRIPTSDLPSFPEFPSKVNVTPDGWICDNGDMNLFNGLLCAVGDGDKDEGCRAVQRGQDADGSWWRAPSKVGIPDPSQNPDTVQTTFNSDQALGVYLYLEQTGDAEAFGRWLDWISNNPICNTTSGNCGWPGQARFCSNFGDCAMHPIDCALILLLGQLYGQQTRSIQICGGALMMGLATPLDMAQWISDAQKTFDVLSLGCTAAEDEFKDAYKKAGIPPPPVPKCSDAFKLIDTATDQLKSGYQKVLAVQSKVEQMLHLPGPGATIAYENAIALASINARVNEKSEARHLAAVALLVLKKINPADPRIRDAALSLLAREVVSSPGKQPDNALILYLTEGSRKPEMLSAIIDKCPATDFDSQNSSPREQWAWEREDKEDTLTQTMYWDCIFAAKLWKYDTQRISPPVPLDPVGLEAFRQLQDAQASFRTLVGDLTAQINSKIGDLIAQLNHLLALFNPLKILPDVLNRACQQFGILCPFGSSAGGGGPWPGFPWPPNPFGGSGGGGPLPFPLPPNQLGGGFRFGIYSMPAGPPIPASGTFGTPPRIGP